MSSYCFTLNNYDPAGLGGLGLGLGLEYSYLIYGKEVGQSGTPHLQGYVQLLKKTRISKKLQQKYGHLEKRKGTVEQAIAYCKKDGDFTEFGEVPLTGGEANKRRWEGAWEMAKAGKFEDVPADIRIRSYRTLKEIRKDYMVAPLPNDEMENYWMYGLSGCGKSRYARETYPNAYYKMANKWWDGYQGQDVVIIEDLDERHNCLGHHLKIWGDHGAFLAETKGGAIMIRPKIIFITSNYHPISIWNDENMLEPIKRRYQIIHKKILEKKDINKECSEL